MSPPRSRPAPRPPLTSARVVEVAAAIADRDGLDALNLTRVAESLGVTQPALYNHVDGAGDLLRLLSLFARDQLADRLRRAAVGSHRRDAVFAVATAWRAFAREHPGLYRSTDRCPIRDDPEQKAAVAEVVGVLEDALQGFALPELDRQHAAWSLRSALHGFCIMELEGGHPLPGDLDTGYRRLVELLCAGFERLGGAAP